jgi:hypothetical protein
MILNPHYPADIMHYSPSTRRMQEGGKLVKQLSGIVKDSASSAENNFQSYHYKILPTQICELAHKSTCLLPTEN